jgi:acyl carrier protein
MNTHDLSTALVELINNEVGLDPNVIIDADTDLLVADVVDSLGVVQIVTWLEDQLGIKIAPADVTIENFATVRLMVALAERLAV